jgi:hypothetical protein
MMQLLHFHPQLSSVLNEGLGASFAPDICTEKGELIQAPPVFHNLNFGTLANGRQVLL